jgi:hypothetical protein
MPICMVESTPEMESTQHGSIDSVFDGCSSVVLLLVTTLRPYPDTNLLAPQ